MVAKKLILAVEGTAAVGLHWEINNRLRLATSIRSYDRRFCRNEPSGQETSVTQAELSLVTFSSHGQGPSRACLVQQRESWTKDMDVFFHRLSSIQFSGGGGSNDAAIAEGLADALKAFSPPRGNENQIVEGEKHCILVAASNPYPLQTVVYRPQFQDPESNETRPDDYFLSDAGTLAKYFPQCAISLSIICPKKLPKLIGIYNAGKCDPQAGDQRVLNLKNPHFLVLISEFLSQRILGRPVLLYVGQVCHLIKTLIQVCHH